MVAQTRGQMVGLPPAGAAAREVVTSTLAMRNPGKLKPVCRPGIRVEQR